MRDHWAYIRSGNAWRLIPYPLRATCISLKLNPFGFWVKPEFTKENLTEQQKKDGQTIWWARWAWFQISFSRWV